MSDPVTVDVARQVLQEEEAAIMADCKARIDAVLEECGCRITASPAIQNGLIMAFPLIEKNNG